MVMRRTEGLSLKRKPTRCAFAVINGSVCVSKTSRHLCYPRTRSCEGSRVDRSLAATFLVIYHFITRLDRAFVKYVARSFLILAPSSVPSHLWRLPRRTAAQMSIAAVSAASRSTHRASGFVALLDVVCLIVLAGARTFQYAVAEAARYSFHEH